MRLFSHFWKTERFALKSGVAGALFLGCALLAGCKPSNAAPTPLPVEQIPAAMRKAFVSAAPGTKQLVEQMLEALQATNYPAAYQGVQAVSAAAGNTREQMLVASRAMLSLNDLLKQASTQGDAVASEFINYQKHNR
jgi:hypothetical protein